MSMSSLYFALVFMLSSPERASTMVLQPPHNYRANFRRTNTHYFTDDEKALAEALL